MAQMNRLSLTTDTGRVVGLVLAVQDETPLAPFAGGTSGAFGMRLVLARLAVSLMLATPAVADPIVKASMPAVHASIADGELLVRLDQGVLGSARSLSPRTIVVLGHDASGKVIAETSTLVSRRMTYARTQLTPALAGASTIAVSVR